MNIQTVAENLRNTIAGKEKYLAEWNNADLVETADQIHRATIAGMLTINIAELKRILQDVEQCCEKATHDSWRDNPDRSGGQFTQDEIDNANRW